MACGAWLTTLLWATVIIALFPAALSDLFLHNPRGSNNRLDEATRNRNNANRMFDSQNNDRGGYNVGGLYYYRGSELLIEWTNQHSCGGSNNHCELVLQYMCGDGVRDGATRTAIPYNPAVCYNYNCTTDPRYGMNEDWRYYATCFLRTRNKGLFTADRKLKRLTARHTRQNQNGNRRGFECPEERDYYPYWHPSPWRDIAVLTNDAHRCPFYASESENVKGRWACVIPDEYLFLRYRSNRPVIQNNKQDCESHFCTELNRTCGRWVEFPSHGIPEPDCRESDWSRDNHNGNGIGGEFLNYKWKIPDSIGEKCVLRVRYNISTGEFGKDGWDATVNASLNSDTGKPTKLDISAKYNFESEQAAQNRGYVFKQNPQPLVFEDAPNFKLQLAVNTNQYGRTFQDRSHVFVVKDLPADFEGTRVHNLNVRGKRGNIVQVYPAVEYDFTPNSLHVQTDDHVHIQWTGSNTNPRNNDGQGLAGTDRSNMLLQAGRVYPEGSADPDLKFGHFGRSYPEHISNSSFLGFSKDLLIDLAILRNYQLGGEMSELDDAGTYFDIGLRKVTQAGNYTYLSTRNNNFSNRSQKGKLIVTDTAFESRSVGWMGGNISLGYDVAELRFASGTFDHLRRLTMYVAKVDDQVGLDEHTKASFASNLLVVEPQELVADHGDFQMKLKLTRSHHGYRILVFQTNGDFTEWIPIETSRTTLFNSNYVSFSSNRGGIYVAKVDFNYGIMFAVIGASLFVVGSIFGFVIYYKRKSKIVDNQS